MILNSNTSAVRWRLSCLALLGLYFIVSASTSTGAGVPTSSRGPTGASRSAGPADEGDWVRSPAALQGVDPIMLAFAYERVREIPQSYGLLVIKNGYLVGERYFNGKTAASRITLASVTKSITSALIGIAIEKGYIPGVGARMMSFFPQYDLPNLDPRKREITVKQLLQMRAGYPRDDNSSIHFDMLVSGNWIRYLIQDRALIADPGTAWAYSGGSSHLLSGILTATTGMSAMDFAREHLFGPLRINPGRWPIDPQGINAGFGDISLTARDLARFAYLYLRGGSFAGQQVVPASWVNASLQGYSSAMYAGAPYVDYQYGYHWWLARIWGHQVYGALGHGGNFAVIVPDLDLEIVTTAWYFPNEPGSWDTEGALFYLIADVVVPAVEGAHEPPPFRPLQVRAEGANGRRLRWSHNPKNAKQGVSAYRIYRYDRVQIDPLRFRLEKSLVAEVSGRRTQYQLPLAAAPSHGYGVAAVAALDRESVVAPVQVQNGTLD